MPANESSARAYFIGRFDIKVFLSKMCVAFTNIWNEYSLKIETYSQLCFDCESNKHTLKIFFAKKKFEGLIIPVAIESLLYLTPFQAKVDLVGPETLTGSKSSCSTVLFFLFNSIIITKLLSADLKKESHLLPVVSNMSKRRILIYTLDIYNLQTKSAFYECQY